MLILIQVSSYKHISCHIFFDKNPYDPQSSMHINFVKQYITGVAQITFSRLASLVAKKFAQKSYGGKGLGVLACRKEILQRGGIRPLNMLKQTGARILLFLLVYLQKQTFRNVSKKKGMCVFMYEGCVGVSSHQHSNFDDVCPQLRIFSTVA